MKHRLILALPLLAACDSMVPSAEIDIHHSCSRFTATYRFSLPAGEARTLQEVGFVGSAWAENFGRPLTVEAELFDGEVAEFECVIGGTSTPFTSDAPFSGNGDAVLQVTTMTAGGPQTHTQPANLRVVHPVADACFDRGSGAVCTKLN